MRWPWGLVMGLVGWLLVGCQGGGTESAVSTATKTPTPLPEPATLATTAEATSTPTAVPAATTVQKSATADADVRFVEALETAPGVWRFNVTVAHPDTGWEDYADGWDVVLPDGAVARPDGDSPFTRLLLHPHENEQPFTRGQSGIAIPPGVEQVTVRAHDIVDGWGGREIVVPLVNGETADYLVETYQEE